MGIRRVIFVAFALLAVAGSDRADAGISERIILLSCTLGPGAQYTLGPSSPAATALPSPCLSYPEDLNALVDNFLLESKDLADRGAIGGAIECVLLALSEGASEIDFDHFSDGGDKAEAVPTYPTCLRPASRRIREGAA